MKKMLIAATLAATLSVPAHATTFTDLFTSYYAFGDSLTDDGKLPDAALNPVSDDGRFSNGPTWAEYIAAEFDGTGKNTANLALGGATGNDENFFAFDILSTFAGQIATFTAAVLSGDPLPVRTSETDLVVPQSTNTGSNPLVSLLFGGNDLFQSAARALENATNSTGPTTVQGVLEAAADRVADGIEEISELAGGNVFDDFLLLTLPGRGDAAFFNDRLATNLTDARFGGLNIITLDVDTVFDQIIGDALFNNGDVFGITDVLGICTASLNQQGPNCADNGVDPNTIALVDTVHPNAVVHRVLGERAIAVLPVPLPAGLPLMLAGLGAFALVRKRSAA